MADSPATMSWLRWVPAALALSEAGFMVFDGARALTVGDYLTPRSGQYAGQLGPWTGFVEAVGVDPRSEAMKWTFVVFGLVWLVVIVFFALAQPWAWWAMLAFAIGSLWYLVAGTVTSVIVLVLLLVPAVRSAYLS